MKYKLVGTVELKMTEADAYSFNCRSMDENLQALRKTSGNSRIVEYNLRNFTFNEDNTTLTVKVEIFEPEENYTESHKKNHEKLHKNLDELVADWIRHSSKPGVNEKTLSNTSILDLMEWSAKQVKNPTEL